MYNKQSQSYVFIIYIQNLYIYIITNYNFMKSFSRLKQKIHWTLNYIKLNPKIQIILYSIAALIIISIFVSLSFAPLFSSEDFVTYTKKECFKKRDINSTVKPAEINYATVSDMLIMTYEFEQKCYDDLELSNEIIKNNVSIIVKTENINEDCLCSSKIVAKMGPISDKNFTVNVYKDTDEIRYLVNTENFTSN